jgi:EmrB/QacA subfamily drug resistance transporter
MPAQTSESKILLVAITGSFMEILDQTVMNVALPHIIAVYNVAIDHAQLIVSTYLMASAISTPTAAFLSQRFGIKRVYMIAQIGFLIGSILCGLSWSADTLIAFRIIQGLSGGLMNPLSMTFIYMSVPPERRGHAMSMLGIPLMLAPAIGPTFGGYLVTYWSWRTVFFINVPIAVIAILLGILWIEDTPTSNPVFDVPGFIFAAAGFSCILYGLTNAPTWHWDDWRIITLLSVGGACLLTWVLIELAEKNPLLDLRMFQHRGYAVGLTLTFTTTIGLYSLVFLLPLFLQTVRGLTAFQGGMMILPQVLGAMITLPIAGRLFDKTGPRIPAVVGLVILCAMSLAMQMLDVTFPDNLLATILFIRGMGMGMAMMPIMTYALSSVPPRLTAQASSMLNVWRMVFASLGIAVFASLLDTFTKTNIENMVQTVTPDSSMALSFLSRVQVVLMQAGMSAQAASQEALTFLYAYVSERANILAFETDYVIGALVVLGGVILALILLPSGRVAKVAGEVDITM